MRRKPTVKASGLLLLLLLLPDEQARLEPP